MIRLQLLAFALLSLALAVGCRKADQPAADPATIKTTTEPDNPPAESPAKSGGSQPALDPGEAAAQPRPKLTDPEKADLRTLAVRLVERTPDGGWRISEQAALELEKRGPDAASELWPLLEDPSAETRRGAAFFLLGQFNSHRPEQVDAFLRLLQDKDDLVRGIAVQAVQQMRTPDLVSSQAIVAELLSPEREPNPQQRIALVRVLQRLKAQAAESAPQLRQTVETDPDAKVRAAALVALAQIAPPAEVVTAAEKALADDDAAVRLAAAARLRQLGPAAAPAASAIAKALRDDDERVRTAAAESLVRLSKDAVDPLIAQLEAPLAESRQLAAACLARLGGVAAPALPALEKRLKDEDETVRKLAQNAIAKIEAATKAEAP